jgi:hypothetical protein
MRIDGSPGSKSNAGVSAANTNRPGTVDGVGAGVSAAADQASVAGQFQPTSDFLALVGTLDRIPLIRQEVLGEVAKQLSGGELDTPQARQQTVESMLGAGPGHD